MTKVATRKTAGVMGDDLALNAEQVTGVKPDRELPVVWAVAKGSALNKAILVPAALLISALAPWLIVPLLMLGGAFLCFEGFEKVAHKLLHSKEDDEKHHQELLAAVADPSTDLVAFEQSKIKGAIRTDFILSAEILVIALGTAVDASLAKKAVLLTVIAVLFTVVVYGLVAGIVKLDDAGLALNRRSSALARGLGRGILVTTPWLMKGLSIAGTTAMFLVGGGIIVHGVPILHKLAAGWAASAAGVPFVGAVVPMALDGLVGVVVGGVIVLGVSAGGRLLRRKPDPAAG